MLLWSMLHLTRTQSVNTDYERLGRASVTLDDIRRFRQLDSKAPGHPEYHWVSGFETTTGPLGVLPPNVTARVAVEQASTLGWERYVGVPAELSA